MALIENAIPLAEVAKVVKTTVAKLEDEARALLIFVGVDWANRPAVSTGDAHGLVTGEARKLHAHEVAWSAHNREAEEWQRARDEVVAVARGIGYRGAFLAGDSNSKAEQAGMEAGREAGRAFEEEHPPPVWQDGSQPVPGAQRRYTADHAFRRVVDKLTGAVA